MKKLKNSKLYRRLIFVKHLCYILLRRGEIHQKQHISDKKRKRNPSCTNCHSYVTVMSLSSYRKYKYGIHIKHEKPTRRIITFPYLDCCWHLQFTVVSWKTKQSLVENMHWQSLTMMTHSCVHTVVISFHLRSCWYRQLSDQR